MSNRPTWRTWSGTARCAPATLLAPTREEEIVHAVRTAAKAGRTVRPVGTGHSFNQLACTDGTLLDLTRFRGVAGVDRAAGTVTVRAGTSLHMLSTALDRAGLALGNLGTIAAQTVAGALATGNHGTGLTHPPFSGQVTRLRLVTADGSVRECDTREDPELFRCARTSLGALGVITEVTLRVVPRFNLRAVLGREPLDALLERFGEWAGSAEHVSFSWLPWADGAATRALDRTAAPPTPRAALHRYDSTLAEVRCGLSGLAGRLRPGIVPRLGRTPATGERVSYVDTAHRVFAFPQPIKFLAMEHALPLENIPAALAGLRGALRRFGHYSPYSVLVRVGAPDDSPLSPAYGRRTGYVNLCVPRTAGYIEILRVAEPVLRDLDARPHWGKAHTATAEILRPRYPEWESFARVRAALDPDGVFANDYLGRVLGPVHAGQPA
ncbi:D-arabinono-1,4-lactone oxidase [Nonomuraea sp. NPDC059007]|uniref:D-arabinono-1,4-lactone oxidase n=1 Tax=Nonomuraea sp. NPDC059007 TaxID=3346692 RepID=UPI00367D9EA0